MDFLWIPGALVALALVLTFFLRRALYVEEYKEPAPQPRQVLVPSVEQDLLRQLEQLLDSSCRLFWQVRLSDLLRIGRGSPWVEPEPQSLLTGRTFSCVVCDREEFTILAVIDFRANHQEPRPAAGQLIPGVELPIVEITEADCTQGNLSALLLARFPELESRLAVPSVVLRAMGESPLHSAT